MKKSFPPDLQFSGPPGVYSPSDSGYGSGSPSPDYVSGHYPQANHPLSIAFQSSSRSILASAEQPPNMFLPPLGEKIRGELGLHSSAQVYKRRCDGKSECSRQENICDKPNARDKNWSEVMDLTTAKMQNSNLPPHPYLSRLYSQSAAHMNSLCANDPTAFSRFIPPFLPTYSPYLTHLTSWPYLIYGEQWRMMLSLLQRERMPANKEIPFEGLLTSSMSQDCRKHIPNNHPTDGNSVSYQKEQSPTCSVMYRPKSMLDTKGNNDRR